MTGPVNVWNLEVANDQDGATVHFRGSSVVLDESNSELVRQKLYQLAEELEPCRLAIDFTDVSFLTSTTLSMLLTVRKKWLARGGRFLLVNLAPEINDVFETTRLNTVFELG